MELSPTDFSNFSGFGSGSGSGSTSPPYIPNFPCRAQHYSTNSTAPIVWNTLPQLQHARWYVIAIESVFLVVGLTWNLIILGFYTREPKLLKEPANIFLFNLAIADILFSIFITLSSLTAEAAGEFVFGSSDFSRCIYCKFLGAVMFTLICLSLYTIAALSINRCMVLTQPIHYKSIFTWKIALVVQIFLWVISIAMSLPPLIGFGDYEYNLAFSFCNARWTGENKGIPNIYYILLYGLQAMIPIGILIFTNIWIIKIAKTVLKSRITRQRTFKNNNADISSEERKYQKQQVQLVRVFGALLVAHTLCWLPVLTVTFVSLGLGADKIPLEVFVVVWLTFLTSPVVHPILETCFVKALRYRVNKTGRTMTSSLRSMRRTLTSQVSLMTLPKSQSVKRFPTSLTKLSSPLHDSVNATQGGKLECKLENSATNNQVSAVVFEDALQRTKNVSVTMVGSDKGLESSTMELCKICPDHSIQDTASHSLTSNISIHNINGRCNKTLLDIEEVESHF